MAFDLPGFSAPLLAFSAIALSELTALSALAGWLHRRQAGGARLRSTPLVLTAAALAQLWVAEGLLQLLFPVPLLDGLTLAASAALVAAGLRAASAVPGAAPPWKRGLGWLAASGCALVLLPGAWWHLRHGAVLRAALGRPALRGLEAGLAQQGCLSANLQALLLTASAACAVLLALEGVRTRPPR